MKLSQFESHPVWPAIKTAGSKLSELRANDTGANIDALQEAETQVAFLASLYRARRRSAPLVFPAQLDTMQSNFAPVLDSLEAALGQREAARAQYLQQTQQYMLNVFNGLGTWATVTPTQVEERLEVSVVDELLAKSQDVDAHMRARLENLEVLAAEVESQVKDSKKDATESEKHLAVVADEAKRAVEAEKARIGTVVDEGQKTIAGFEGDVQAALDGWHKEFGKQFTAGTKALREQQQTLLDNSKKRYDELKATVADYQAIVQAESADRLAVHYEAEAQAARKSGWITIVVGFLVLLAAAIPLLLAVLQPVLNEWWGWSLKEADWPSLAARAGVAAVLVGAATVAIRMGSGFHGRADEYKRLAMELRTMGPFLSTVADTESVDQARLDLINRTFGQSYAPTPDATDVDTVPVSVLQQLLTMVTKAIK